MNAPVISGGVCDSLTFADSRRTLELVVEHSIPREACHFSLSWPRCFAMFAAASGGGAVDCVRRFQRARNIAALLCWEYTELRGIAYIVLIPAGMVVLWCLHGKVALLRSKGKLLRGTTVLNQRSARATVLRQRKGSSGEGRSRLHPRRLGRLALRYSGPQDSGVLQLMFCASSQHFFSRCRLLRCVMALLVCSPPRATQLPLMKKKTYNPYYPESFQ